MSGILEKWFREKNLRKWFRKDNLIVLILGGILLVIIALPTKDSQGTVTENPQADRTNADETLSADNKDGLAVSGSDEEYARQLEQRLRDACPELPEAELDKIVDLQVRAELKSGVQTIQYQLNTLMTTNG